MKKYTFLLLLLFISSCSTHKEAIYDSRYEGEPNYKSFYVVDTIQIEDPVVVCHEGRFVCSRKLLDTVKIDKNFFERPDVFLLSQYGLYNDLDLADFDKYLDILGEECKTEVKTTLNTELETKYYKVYLREFKTPPAFFILGLINANYYNKNNMTIDGSSYLMDTKDQKTSYYKIVYPYCSK